MLILNAWKIRKLYKEAKENPGKVAGEELRGALAGLVFLPAIMLGAVLAVLFVFGFTPLAFGPSLIARGLFYILAPLYLLALFIISRVVRRLKQHAGTLTNDTMKTFER